MPLRRLTWKGDDEFQYEEHCQPPPSPGPWEVTLQVKAVGVCSTDLHILSGSFPLAHPPLVLGHEIAGEIIDVGEEVSRVRPGDRVTVDQVVGCGECYFCRRGSRQFCPQGYELGMTRDGGCQDLLMLPEENAYPIAESITFEEAAILDMEVWGALAKCGVRPDDTALVVGHGPAGLVACQILRALGARKVILCGRSLARLERAGALGVADRIVSSGDGFLDVVKAETDGLGVDIAFECSGTPSGVESAIAAAKPGGRVVVYGVQAGPLDGFDLNQILLKDLVVYGTLSDRRGWEEVIDLVSRGELALGPLITHRFPLHRAQEAYQLVRSRAEGVIKAVLML